MAGKFQLVFCAQLTQIQVEEFVDPFIAVLRFELSGDLCRFLAVGRVDCQLLRGCEDDDGVRAVVQELD
jgi:hypothetical protein